MLISFIRRSSQPPAKLKPKVSTTVDHRLIAQTQKLFMTDPRSAGNVFVLPHGQRIIERVKSLLRVEYAKQGFNEVQTPILYNTSLFKLSGHLDNYADDMFMLKENADSSHKEVESTAFGLKPMNCPAHCLIYQNESRSFRDLPQRYADFTALHRNELSGALTGMTRLRQFHQDDGHIFCTQSQVSSEIAAFLKMVKHIYIDIFKFRSFSVGLSTRPSDGRILGTAEEWQSAEQALKGVLNSSFGDHYSINEGDGAFYGPKIDIHVTDDIGRKHQLATLQLDFQLPRRFDLQYQDTESLRRPVLIHRAILGSLERFLAVWMESIQGKWPFWVSPRQCLIIPLVDQPDNVHELREKLRIKHADDYFSTRYHVEIDTNIDNTLSKRIREAEMLAFNYILIVGKKELQSGLLSVRTRGSKVNRTMSLADVKKEFADKESLFE